MSIDQMPAPLRRYFQHEISESRKALLRNNVPAAWHHLERAHILGQEFPWAHLFSHWQMLKLSLRLMNFREAFGQMVRLCLAIPGALTHRIPMGNTGRSNVGLFQTMPTPKDLQKILDENDG